MRVPGKYPGIDERVPPLRQVVPKFEYKGRALQKENAQRNDEHGKVLQDAMMQQAIESAGSHSPMILMFYCIC
jgi:hypothetical protein